MQRSPQRAGRRRERPPVLRRLVGVAAVALTIGASLAALHGGSATAKRAPRAVLLSRPTVVAPAVHIPAKLVCSTLVQNGGKPNSFVPNFEDIKGAPTRINSATVVAATATAPEYCDIKGYVLPQVQFELKLPTTQWLGRYLQQGCGGFCGMVNETTFPSCDSDLGGDFAIAATDDGHKTSSALDALWADNYGLRVDLGYRAAHVVAVAAKAIMSAYYGHRPTVSYFAGCSDGGREALMEAQRYPTDFNGILAGSPAQLATLSQTTAYEGVVNTGAHGEPILTADKIPGLHAAVVAACDRNDGIVGNGLIGDPRDCTFDPATIRCAGASQPTCLTPAQVTTVRKMYAPPVTPRGELVGPSGLQRGAEFSWLGWFVPIPPPSTAPPGTASTWISRDASDDLLKHLLLPPGQGVELSQWKFDARHFAQLRPAASIFDSLNPDLRRFRANGGRLLLYQGWADSAVSPQETVTYFDAVTRFMHGTRATEKFARLFTIPGMGHCTGGPTPDTSTMLRQLVRWVERDHAPESILAVDKDPALPETQKPKLP